MLKFGFVAMVVSAATLVVPVGVVVLVGRGTVVGGLVARAVLAPPLPQPQFDQLEGDQPQPPPLRQPPAEASDTARHIEARSVQ
jgi:hypothetical protein